MLRRVHPGLTLQQMRHVAGMVEQGANEYARQHGPFDAAVLKAFMLEMAAFVQEKHGPPKPRPVVYQRPDYHYDHVMHWNNGTLSESIEWVPRQDLLAAARAADRNRYQEPY